jgi:creatinine amidohydrolase
MTFVDMAEVTWPRARELAAESAVGLIPVGSLEQHGPHLPIAIDSLFAQALAVAVAERIEEPVAVPPLFMAGLSDHHLAFPGTVSLSPDVFGGVLTAYVEGFERIGIRRIGVISGHGGNFAFIGEFGRAYTASHPGTRVVGYDDFQPFVDVMFAGGASVGLTAPETDVHAGALETSMALHLLGRERIGDFEHVNGYTAAEDGWLERMRTDGIDALTETGVLGLPAGASAAAGHAIVDGLADLLSKWLIAELGVTARAVSEARR